MKTSVRTTTLRARILPLEEEWFHQIPQMIRSWFHAEAWPLTIFSCPGYTDYLLENLKVPAKQRTQLFYGAFSGGRLAGFAEWRLLGDSLLLNNLFVSPGFRGSGIGRMLIEAGRNLADEKRLSSILLDVFTWEPKTVRWYREMGFNEQYRRNWYTGANPFARETERGAKNRGAYAKHNFLLEGFPQAEACHRWFGFSSFEAKTGTKTHQVGRLHQRYYRLHTNTAELDPELLAGLAELDPGRQLFVISPAAEWPVSLPLNPICTSIRLGLSLFS